MQTTGDNGNLQVNMFFVLFCFLVQHHIREQFHKATASNLQQTHFASGGCVTPNIADNSQAMCVLHTQT